MRKICSSLNNELSSLQSQLVDQQSLFSQSDLDRVRGLSHRINSATALVNSHASIVTIFNALDNVIADPVQFLTFNYNRSDDIRKPTLSLSAVATEFDEIIFQDGIMKNNSITGQFRIDSVNLATQPIDEERLELGLEQVVNVNLSTELPVSDINYSGASIDAAELILNSDEPVDDFDSDGEINGEADGVLGTNDEAAVDGGLPGDDSQF